MRKLLLLAPLALLPSFAFAQTHPTVMCSGQDATAEIAADVAVPNVIVTLLAGTCLVSAPVMPATGVTLNGQGAGTSILRATQGDAFPVVQVGDGTSAGSVTGVHIANLTIDGAAEVGDDNGMNADDVIVKAYGNATLTAVELINAGDSGVKFAGSGEVNHSTIHYNYHSGVDVMAAIVGHLAGPVIINGNYVANNSLERPLGTGTGPGAEAWDYINCDNGHTGCSITYNKVVGGDVLVDDRTTTEWSGQDTMTNNTIYNSPIWGVAVWGNVDGFNVSSNTMSTGPTQSIVVVPAAENGTISGNTVTSGGPIVIHQGTTNVTCSGNNIPCPGSNTNQVSSRR